MTPANSVAGQTPALGEAESEGRMDKHSGSGADHSCEAGISSVQEGRAGGVDTGAPPEHTAARGVETMEKEEITCRAAHEQVPMEQIHSIKNDPILL